VFKSFLYENASNDKLLAITGRAASFWGDATERRDPGQIVGGLHLNATTAGRKAPCIQQPSSEAYLVLLAYDG
jgi:hypothetical protein